MNKSLKWRTLTIVAAVCVSLYFIITNSFNLGLDLSGGTHFTIEVLVDDLTEEERKDAIERVLAVYRNRIDEIGVAGTTVQRGEGNRIFVQVPGIETKDANRIKNILKRQARLEFRLVVDGPNDL